MNAEKGGAPYQGAPLFHSGLAFKYVKHAQTLRPREDRTLKKAEDCADMSEVRAEIDRVDSALVELLAERWTYVDRAWVFKRAPEEASVPWRNREVIDKVRTRAGQTGLPPEMAEALWRLIIGWGIQYEEERLRKD